MEKKNLLRVLSNDNFLILSRDLVKEIGLDEAILLGELCHEQVYWETMNKLQKDGTFYTTVENIEKQIGLKKNKQLVILKKLKALNLIEIKYHDIPRKRYIKVNVFELEKIQNKYKKKEKEKEKTKEKIITLNKSEYDIINKVFFENEFSNELKNTFSEYVLELKKYKNFEVTLKNVRGLAKSLREFKESSIEDQKKIINKSKQKRWTGFYPIKKKKSL